MRKRIEVLNWLLLSLTLLGAIGLILSLVGHIFFPTPGRSLAGLYASIAFPLLTGVLWIKAKRGSFLLPSILLLTFLWLAGVACTVIWSYEMPIASVVLSLSIILSSVLLDTRPCLIYSSFVLVSFIAVFIAQYLDLLQPSYDWYSEELNVRDLAGLTIVVITIVVVSLAGNAQLMKALKRAEDATRELAAEREKLELKVIERTKELERSQRERLLQVQKFAELGRISAGLVHDLANPVTSASLSLQLFEREGRQKMIAHTRESLSVIEEYLHAARNQIRHEGHPSVFEASSAIEESLRLIASSLKRNHILLDFQHSRHVIIGDRIRFQQLMLNLLTNAIDSFDDVERKEKKICIAMKDQGEKLSIAISDNGVGIKPDVTGHIFRPDYSTKKIDKGSGIGLMLCKQTVEDSFKGAIHVKSESGKGSTFTVTLEKQTEPSEGD